ncbi:hypothetical protein KAF81_32835 [Pseudomonas aeruginosa]|uniref:hypothetical protein n=1 Tax=Pseudomonas aeruginosa TaxID=287 RepID=UPI001B36AECF|nr:hypothetical protein [Pseudomonas aeruginosa]MBP8322430.1 hypothetical protein [Pseudomonas aeruginosa]
MTINRNSVQPPSGRLVASKPVQEAARPAPGRILGRPVVVLPSETSRSYGSRFHSGLAGLWASIKACFSPQGRAQACGIAKRPDAAPSPLGTAPAVQARIDPVAHQREVMGQLYAVLEQPAADGHNLDAVVRGLRRAVEEPQGDHPAFAWTLDAAIEKAMDRYRDFHMKDSDSIAGTALYHLRQHPDAAAKVLNALPPALRAKAQALLSTIIWNMGCGHAEAFSFLQLARRVQASMAAVTEDYARSTGDNPYVEQALRSDSGYNYDAPELGSVGSMLDRLDMRVLEIVENKAWDYQSGRYPASQAPEVIRAAMTGFKALTPQELDKLELVSRLRCGQPKFAVAPDRFAFTNEPGLPLSHFMRGALRGCYEERIGRELESCVRSLRRQGFPQAYAGNMSAARSMMASAAGKVLSSASHYAHTLDSPQPPDTVTASRLLLNAGLAQQSAQDAEWIMDLLRGDGAMSHESPG